MVVRRIGEVVDVAVVGELNPVTSAQLRQTLVRFETDGAKTVIIDLSAVASVDSTALGVLVGGAKRLRERQGDLVIKAPTPRTQEVFDVTGLSGFFTISGVDGTDGRHPVVMFPTGPWGGDGSDGGPAAA